MNTEDLAERLGIKSQSIRARLCRTGSYFGERPKTAVNGRLVWDDKAPERLVASEQPEGANEQAAA